MAANIANGMAQLATQGGMADLAGEFMGQMATANPEMAGMMAAGMTQMMGNQGAGFMADMGDFMGADMAQQLQADMQAGMADMQSMMQAQMQAGDMFMGALLPGLVLVLLYMLYILIAAYLKPDLAPAVPLEGKRDRSFIVKVLLSLIPPLTLNRDYF